MGLFYFEVNDCYRLGIWKMVEDEDKLQTTLKDYNLSVPFTNPGKRVEYLSVRALALQMDIDPLDISYHSSGKPYLKDSKTNISISHTKGYAAILLSETALTGIDIERKSDKVLKVKRKFISPEEEKNIPKETDSEILALLLHWSAKESVYKAIPDDGVDFIKELRILDYAIPQKKGFFLAKALRSSTIFQVDYRVEKEFVLTACFPLNK